MIDRASLAERLWSKDATLWGPGEDDPADRLGWLHLPSDMAAEVERLDSLGRKLTEGTELIALLGMGGSSLAPEVFARVVGAAPGRPSLRVFDSTHPDEVRSAAVDLKPERTVFVVSSKSGTTAETMSLYRHFSSLTDDGDRFVAITDANTPLQQLAVDQGFAEVFVAPADVGGRFSALSVFGLVPAALTGIDCAALLARARAAAEETRLPRSVALQRGVDLAELARTGRDKVTFVLSERLAPFGDWLEQLLAESTGKRGTGLVPIVNEPPIAPEDYGPDRVFVYMFLTGDDAPSAPSPDGLRSAGHPVFEIRVDVPLDLGAEMFGWEFATAVAGAELGINAFDQPDVESAKKATRAALEQTGDLSWPADDPEGVFAGIGPPELAVIGAFAARSKRHDYVLLAARRKLIGAGGIATMTGYGPRYLHSTGQLHKGGPPGVRALVVLDEPEEDVPIPGEAHGFARLVAAQAVGEARALASAGRRVAATTWERFEAWATT